MSSSRITGIVEGVYTTPDPENFVTESQQQLEFVLGGIPNDRHFGHTRLSGGREKKLYKRGTAIHNNRQWSAVSQEELEEIAVQMQLEQIKPEWLGANMLISGIEHFSKLKSMTRLEFFSGETQTAVLIVYGQNRPCLHPHRAMEVALDRKIEVPFTKAAYECRGLVGWVEKAGMVAPGYRVECVSI